MSDPWGRMDSPTSNPMGKMGSPLLNCEPEWTFEPQIFRGRLDSPIFVGK
jgi:hypothetical protein